MDLFKVDSGHSLMHRLEPPRHVLLLIEASSTFTRRLIRGITSYSQSHGPWVITLREGGRSIQLPLLDDVSPYDGIIARIECKELHERIAATKVPFVNVSGTRFNDRVPWVTVNNESVIRLVVQEFRNNHHTNFAFLGPERRTWGCFRETEFRRQVSNLGCRFHSSFFTNFEQSDAAEENQRIENWLKTLPNPIAIMAANDMCGYQLLKACYQAGISVPDQISVIGVNNDELLCELSFPSLTSVSTNTQRIGHKSAEILDQLMSGKKVRESKFQIEPLGIEPRRSTDQAAGADPFVSLAFRFIQRHACDGINVEDILKVVPMSRTSLDAAFRQFIGRSPHHEISRVRIERARQLLSEGKFLVAEVASRCGYSSVEYFSAAFKREVGVSPSEFRRKNG